MVAALPVATNFSTLPPLASPPADPWATTPSLIIAPVAAPPLGLPVPAPLVARASPPPPSPPVRHVSTVTVTLGTSSALSSVLGAARALHAAGMVSENVVAPMAELAHGLPLEAVSYEWAGGAPPAPIVVEEGEDWADFGAPAPG